MLLCLIERVREVSVKVFFLSPGLVCSSSHAKNQGVGNILLSTKINKTLAKLCRFEEAQHSRRLKKQEKPAQSLNQQIFWTRRSEKKFPESICDVKRQQITRLIRLNKSKLINKTYLRKKLELSYEYQVSSVEEEKIKTIQLWASSKGRINKWTFFLLDRELKQRGGSSRTKWFNQSSEWIEFN